MAETSIVPELLERNARFREERWRDAEAEMNAIPDLRLAVVACMDARYSIARVLGLRHGEAKILRNAGNVVTDDVVRSLLVAVHLLQVEHVVVLGHSDCGMQKVAPGEAGVDQLLAGVEAAAGTLDPRERHEVAAGLGGFDDPEANVRAGVERLRKHPHLPDDLEVAGLLYDNTTGEVRRVP